MMNKIEEKAELFVDNLLKEGAVTPCDDTRESFKEKNTLPQFYDEELFKKGQEFYHRNIFGILTGKIYGLLSILSIPTLVRHLMFTKQSSSDMTAYRRYIANIFHMTLWYESDFKPGSKLWQSVAKVKRLHNSASNRGSKADIGRIVQKDMALTQFGFMGFQLIRSEFFGVYNATEEEWKAFIHLWRVIGHLLGVEDRFNICRSSVEETKAICEKLVERVFLPNIRKKDPDFIQMAKYMVNGLSAIQPLLNFNVVMCMINNLLINNINNDETEEFKNLTFWEKCIFYFIRFMVYCTRWAPVRWCLNYSRYRDLWFMKNFPLLAYYRFGFKKGRVRILGKYQ